MRTIVIPSVALLVAVGQVAGQDCEYEATRTAMLQATSADALELIALAGSLTVRGVDDLSEVRVVGRACASSQELLDELRLETERSGSTVRVEVVDGDDELVSRGNSYRRMDLEVEVPRGMAARIDDGSGDMLVEGLGALSVDDGSGDLELHDIVGDVTLDDGSGGITVMGLVGSIQLDDGSGEIVIRDVEGTVEIADDGSGSISVRNVAGDFIVWDDGSGSIEYANVSGRVRLPRRRR